MRLLLDTSTCIEILRGKQATVLAHYAGCARQSIGGNDLMIAATALAHGLTVVTHNLGEFQRIDGLLVEDWHVG